MKNRQLNFKRVLIANRGEIAIRIARALKELGHIPIGIWTEAEENAAHLEHCDEWVSLSGKNIEETYLDQDKIIALAKSVKADAIHPGHGFLSEDPSFALKCLKSNLLFIGPGHETLILVEDKINTKRIVNDLGVNTIPGTERISNIEAVIKFGKKEGYPIILKPTKGKNGKCLKVIKSEDELRLEFQDYFEKIENSEFSREGFFVEKYLENTRHIEVQIIGNKKEVFHFYERECSIQRRFQKIVEEAPSPFIGNDNKLREELTSRAILIAKKIGFDGLGTFEFLVDENKKYYFLEINPRMQVAQSVTEEIVGIDLSVLMIQAAFGDDLGISGQDWIRFAGHSVECRLTAEDPKTLTPFPGVVSSLGVVFPQGVRFDHNLYQGLVISSEYDSMLGKLTTKGITRDVAIRKMKVALKGLLIEGTLTNIPLLSTILETEDFESGNYNLGFMKKNHPEEKIDTDIDLQNLIGKVALAEALKLGL